MKQDFCPSAWVDFAGRVQHVGTVLAVLRLKIAEFSTAAGQDSLPSSVVTDSHTDAMEWVGATIMWPKSLRMFQTFGSLCTAKLSCNPVATCSKNAACGKNAEDRHLGMLSLDDRDAVPMRHAGRPCCNH